MTDITKINPTGLRYRETGTTNLIRVFFFFPQDGKVTSKPIKSRIVSLFAEKNDLMFAVPGGLIGVGTKIDPTICRADRMVSVSRDVVRV